MSSSGVRDFCSSTVLIEDFVCVFVVYMLMGFFVFLIFDVIKIVFVFVLVIENVVIFVFVSGVL